jgi:hypothetical protein
MMITPSDLGYEREPPIGTANRLPQWPFNATLNGAFCTCGW